MEKKKSPMKCKHERISRYVKSHPSWTRESPVISVSGWYCRDYGEPVELKKPYVLRIKVPGQPHPLNKMLRMHWGERDKINKDWYNTIGFLTAGKRPKKPLDKAHLSFCLYNTRRLDFDGCVGSLKPLVDGLVHARILRNDSFVVTGQWFVDQKLCKKGFEFVEITITDKT